ncbi:MAG: type III-A CRISPR-associated RAMP protein Csm4 [Candidatus Weimeria sp.]
MDYKIYKLTFPGGVHFGNNSLERSEETFHADTLFSALCQEAVRNYDGALETLVSSVRNGDFRVSDSFPFMGDTLYLPKPYINIRSEKDEGNSKKKKKFKNLHYIPAELYADFLKGDFPIDERGDELKGLGHHMTKTAVNVRNEEAESVPYRVGSFWFEKNCGLYVIMGFENDGTQYMVEDLMDSLSYDGIGGERSSGYGRFEFRSASMPQKLETALSGTHPEYVTLSVSLPDDEELDMALKDASYQMIRRSGFVSSSRYSDTQMRKNDLYVFDAGSVFKNKFEGQIADVSSGGSHPVYRYAEPMFLGVDV